MRPRGIGRVLVIPLLLLSLLGLTAIAGGCSAPEGGSSMPWSQPEPWEQQPQIGVPL